MEEGKEWLHCWCGCDDEEVENVPELPPVQSKVKRKSRQVGQERRKSWLDGGLLLGFLMLWMCLDGGECQEQWSSASDVTGRCNVNLNV